MLSLRARIEIDIDTFFFVVELLEIAVGYVYVVLTTPPCRFVQQCLSVCIPVYTRCKPCPGGAHWATEVIATVKVATCTSTR